MEVDKYLSGDIYNVSAVDLIGDNRVMINYTDKKDFIVENNASNIIISLWTTSLARITLYKTMDKIIKTPGAVLLYTGIYYDFFFLYCLKF